MKIEDLSCNWVTHIISDELSPDCRTDLTFCGAYVEHYEDCTRYWTSEQTREQYNAYLNNVILPALKGHNKKTIDQYTMSDFEDAIDLIQIEGQLRYRNKGEYRPYEDATIQSFRNIIARTMQGAAKNNLCEDLFRDSYFLLNTKDVQEAASGVLFVKKSIPLDVEVNIIEDLLSDCTVTGELVGYLLIIACGLRVNESAAVNFGNILEMKYHPGNYKLMVYESVMINSNTLKTSGKTANANRVIPLYDRVVQFLLARREHVAAALRSDGSSIDVDTLPIACVGNNYSTRCTTKQIADKARELYTRHGVKPKVFQLADLTLRGSELCEIKEKSPTAYLGRHIFATQLYLLGLDLSEIQAVIGHDIEDASVTRNDFGSEEVLYRIKQKMDRMPIYRLKSNIINLSETKSGHSGTGSLSLQVDKLTGYLQISVEAAEPADTITIDCADNSGGQLIVSHKEPDFQCGVDVMAKYCEIYNEIIKHRNKKDEGNSPKRHVLYT